MAALAQKNLDKKQTGKVKISSLTGLDPLPNSKADESKFMDDARLKDEAEALRRLFSDSSSKQDFGRILKALRKQSGLTQEQLAKRVGTSRTQLADIEQGTANPTYDMLSQIIQGLPLPS